MILGIAQLGKVARNLNPLSQPAVSARDFEKALEGIKPRQFRDFDDLQSHVLRKGSGTTKLGRQWLRRTNQPRINEETVIRKPDGNGYQTADDQIAAYKASAMEWLRQANAEEHRQGISPVHQGGIASDLASIANYQQRLDYGANMTAGFTTLALGGAGVGAWTLLNKSDD